MSRIRVLHFISGVAIGNQSGGAELHALQVARYLNKDSFEPLICAAWRYGSPSEILWLEKLSSEGIPVEGAYTTSRNQNPDLRKEFRVLWSVVSRFQPEIIHSHSERYDSINALVRLLHPSRPKAVRTIHLDHQWQSRPHLGPFINSYLFPYLFHYEFGVSQTIFQQLQSSSRRREVKIGLCYNGYDAAVFSNSGESKSSDLPEAVPSDSPRIGIIGRLTDQKGHADLIKAVSAVIDKQPAHLLIIGDGPKRSELGALVDRLALREHVHFLGTRSDTWAILPHLDLFVLPSYWEGFPTVILEAMSQEVPVVASDIPGNRELVHHGTTGLLVQPARPDLLAEAILASLKDPTTSQNMAESARQFASKFTIQNAAACYADIYSRIAGF